MSRLGWREFLGADDVEDWVVLHGGATAVFRAVLGYAPMAEDNAVDLLGHGTTVWMQQLDPAKTLRHAKHIDVSVAR